ncbi:hypothetical protein BDM02DRAFT_3110067 [Thelephora ganbajun]|uniref:Uncharacterized protein n=1 Tax=Thelephora ganbajun TaxID=370292 RepID=A0ACB6ZS27_THEGA|nr:hypothetical protein BDM02DRAFT_3110067 [Thelephora ganbajun]
MFRERSRRGKQTFGILPPYDLDTRKAPLRDVRLPRRVSRILASIIVSLTFLGLYSLLEFQNGGWVPTNLPWQERLPPLYPEYRLRELALPQHNLDLPYPEGRNGKYLWISEHVQAAGWGNALQEHFVNALLAYHSRRAFVFDNYTWNRDGSVYSRFNEKLIPSMIPMTVQIAGPMAGGPFAPGDDTPRSIMKEWFDIVCPNPKRLDKDAIRATLPEDYSAKTVMDAWIRHMEGTPENCVTAEDKIFDIWIFGSKRLLDIVPLLFKSPMVTEFRWSSLIIDGFNRNRKLFAPNGLTTGTPKDPYPVISGLLALHIRRGDFEQHCRGLAEWGSTWTGFNQLPELHDHFDPPPRPKEGNVTQAIYDAYTKSCYPSIGEIVQKVVDIRHTEVGKGLTNIYIMTNGKDPWLSELKRALRKTGVWKQISSSRELRVTREQKFIAQSIDMVVGQRADVLIGNGFSSLTATIVMLRMAKGLDPASTRLWS